MAHTTTKTDGNDPIVAMFALVEEYPVLMRFFDGLGVPTLRKTLAQPGGVLGVVDAEKAEPYCSFAAVIEGGGDNLPDPAALVSFYADCLLNVSCVDSKALREEPDGRVTLHVEGLPPVEVTDESIRHWQWLICLFTIDALATRFLDSMPPAMRERAREAARTRGR